MIKEYIDYLKDNPQGYWFKAKLYGWGWTPATRQGWLITLLYITLVVAIISFREEKILNNPDSGSNFLTFTLPIILLTIFYIFIAYKKGEKPKWQWGPPKK